MNCDKYWHTYPNYESPDTLNFDGMSKTFLHKVEQHSAYYTVNNTIGCPYEIKLVESVATQTIPHAAIQSMPPAAIQAISSEAIQATAQPIIQITNTQYNPRIDNNEIECDLEDPYYGVDSYGSQDNPYGMNPTTLLPVETEKDINYFNQADNYISKYEKEIQNYKFLNEIMQNPKAEILKNEIEARGGSMGIFNVSLIWDNTDDLDLSIICPCNPDCPKIDYNNRSSKCGGKLDIDANAGSTTKVPIENICWEDLPPNGKYKITVTNYRSRNNIKTPFRCLVRYKDIIKAFDGEVANKESIVIYNDIINFI